MKHAEHGAESVSTTPNSAVVVSASEPAPALYSVPALYSLSDLVYIRECLRLQGIVLGGPLTPATLETTSAPSLFS